MVIIRKERMSKTFLSGRIIKRYDIPLKEIEELNNAFDKSKNNLEDKGAKLAGRIDTELSVTDFVPKLLIMETLKKYMNDYLMSLNHFGLSDNPICNVEITSMWINDMQPHEYNPPHTHHDKRGWSTVMFLKVPNLINDVKHKHKFRDGSLGFVYPGDNVKFFEPKVGHFYIFEASHMHFVFPYKTTDKDPIRRSMSFNFEKKDV